MKLGECCKPQTCGHHEQIQCLQQDFGLWKEIERVYDGHPDLLSISVLLLSNSFSVYLAGTPGWFCSVTMKNRPHFETQVTTFYSFSPISLLFTLFSPRSLHILIISLPFHLLLSLFPCFSNLRRDIIEGRNHWNNSEVRVKAHILAFFVINTKTVNM